MFSTQPHAACRDQGPAPACRLVWVSLAPAQKVIRAEQDIEFETCDGTVRQAGGVGGRMRFPYLTYQAQYLPKHLAFPITQAPLILLAVMGYCSFVNIVAVVVAKRVSLVEAQIVPKVVLLPSLGAAVEYPSIWEAQDVAAKLSKDESATTFGYWHAYCELVL